jgi:hypothetical protein
METEKLSFQIDEGWFDFVLIPERSIWVATTPFTNLQCDIVTQNSHASIDLVALPSELNSPKQPRTMISWRESAQLCNALSTLVGLSEAYNEISFEIVSHADGFRLPDWEDWLSSCFAGQVEEQSKFPWGSDPNLSVEYAVTSEDDLKIPSVVATRMPNRVGLFDMLGLVHEWGVDIDEQEDPEGKPFRQSFGGSYEDRLLEPAEGEVGAWPAETRQPTIGLRLYIDDSSKFRSLHQATIAASSSPSVAAAEIDEPSEIPTQVFETFDDQPLKDEAGSAPQSELAQPKSGTELDEAIEIWSLVQPGLVDQQSLIESVLAFSLIPFDLIVANRGAGSSWLDRWTQLKEAVHSRSPQKVPFLELEELKTELVTELEQFTIRAGARNDKIAPWDGRLVTLQGYLPSDDIVGNSAFEDDYFSESVVLNKELELLLENYLAMRSAFDAIMTDAGLVGAAILTGWLTETKLQPADPDIAVVLEAGCKYPVAALADCIAGLKELETSIAFLSSRTSTESLVTPSLARQMWVTLPGRLLATLQGTVSIHESDDASKQFVGLCRTCIHALRGFLESGDNDLPKDADPGEEEVASLPHEAMLLDVLGPFIPVDLLPAHVFRRRANLETSEEAENLERQLAEWRQSFSEREQELRKSFGHALKFAAEVEGVKSVKNDVDHLLNLLDWFQVLIEGGGRTPPELGYIDELVHWSPELTTAYKDNLLTSWRLYQIDDQATRTRKVLDRILGTLACQDHINLQPLKAPATDFRAAVLNLLEVARTYERDGADQLGVLTEAWRTLEHVYEQTPNTIPSLNPLEFFASQQGTTRETKADDDKE